MIALLDADLFVYRIGFASEKDNDGWPICRRRLDHLVSDILLYLDDIEGHRGFLTEGTGNYRHQFAVTAPYKGGRPPRKPKYYEDLRYHLQERWDCVVETTQEADDAIGIAATELGGDSIIVTIDKDLDNISGHHYNFVKSREYHVTPVEADRNFYQQILVGDRTDNVQGIFGIGPITAKRLLKDAKEPKEMYDLVLKEFDGDTDRVLENGRLLWIRRQPNEIWEPPK